MQSAAEWLISEGYPEVDPMDYYRALFPIGTLERENEQVEGKYCAIAITIQEDGKAHRTMLTDGLPQLPDLISGDDFSILSPIEYAGRRATTENARWLHALIFDVDFLRMDKEDLAGLYAIFFYADESYENDYKALPRPTYVIASSDRNIHVVYLLDQPLAMYKNIVQQVKRMRRSLIKKLWESYITEAYESPQYETSAVQGFRLVGSKSKDKKNKVRCFLTGDPVSVEYLNKFVPETARVTDLAYKGKCTLAECKEKYPDWYERRIIKGEPAYGWVCHRGLYDWWKTRVTEIEVGHRYHYLLCMAAYGVKCNIDRDEVLEDIMTARAILDKISPVNNRLTISDATKAAQAFSDQSRLLTRARIADLCGVEIQTHKRNGRTRQAHMKRLNKIIDLDIESGEPDVRYHGGAPTKEDLVLSYFNDHPDQSVTEIARACGVSRPTVYKWIKGRSS